LADTNVPVTALCGNTAMSYVPAGDCRAALGSVKARRFARRLLRGFGLD
jgi:hypothetical protein